MKRKVFLTVVVLMCLALVAQSALAQPGGRGSREGRGPGGTTGSRGGGMMGRGGGMMGRGGGGMFGDLDLTEEQQAKIDKLMEEARNADSPEARRELYGQMREKMQAILTPEQREKMAQRFSGGRGGAGGGRGGAGGRPGGEGGRPGGPDASRARTMGPIQVLDGLLRRLGLNREQQQKIAKIRAEAIKKLFKDVKAVLTKEQNTKLEEAQKRLRAAQQRRPTEGRRGAGGPPEGRGPRRGEGDREGSSRRGEGDRDGGSRRGGGDRDGGPRGRTRGAGDRDREN